MVVTSVPTQKDVDKTFTVENMEREATKNWRRLHANNYTQSQFLMVLMKNLMLSESMWKNCSFKNSHCCLWNHSEFISQC